MPSKARLLWRQLLKLLFSKTNRCGFLTTLGTAYIITCIPDFKSVTCVLSNTKRQQKIHSNQLGWQSGSQSILRTRPLKPSEPKFWADRTSSRLPKPKLKISCFCVRTVASPPRIGCIDGGILCRHQYQPKNLIRLKH